MATFTFKFRGIPNGLAIGAVTESGEVVAEWIKTTTRTARPAVGSYNIHRLAKGDNFEDEDHFEFLGEHAAILAAAEAQLPQALVDAKWAIGGIGDDWGKFHFVEGLAGAGCVWFGNTPAKIVAAAKKAQKTMTFIFP